MGEQEDRGPLSQAQTLADGGVMVVTLTGEVDMTNAQDTRSALQAQLDARPAGLVVDLSVDFIGSAGLATLIEAFHRANQEEIAFAVVAADHAAQRALEVSGLTGAFRMFDNVPAAVEALQSGA